MTLDRSIYEKAREIVEHERVEVVDEADKRVFLEVEGSSDTYGVRVESDHTFACTCPYATLKGLPRGALCSHALAALLHLVDETVEDADA